MTSDKISKKEWMRYWKKYRNIRLLINWGGATAGMGFGVLLYPDLKGLEWLLITVGFVMILTGSMWFRRRLRK